MDPEAAGRAKVRLRVPAVLLALLGAILIVTFTPLGLFAGFSPAVRWARHQNAKEFRHHESQYREIGALIKRDMVGAKPGTHFFYQTASGREVSSLKRLEPPVSDELLARLLQDALLIEAHQYRTEMAVRIVTRSLSTGETFNLIYWDPNWKEDCLWFPSSWWDNDSIEWVDPQWWSTYSSRSGS